MSKEIKKQLDELREKFENMQGEEVVALKTGEGEITLVSRTESMNQLLNNLAWSKENLLKNKLNKKRNYLG